MFKLLILQRLHNLSDERLQYQVTDRLSFMRPLFERLNQAPADLGVELKSGQIIDATFVPVPIQRNGLDDNALVKQGTVPVEWGKTPAKLAQKDIAPAGRRRTGKATTAPRTTSTRCS
jgi:hypothetical protein